MQSSILVGSAASHSKEHSDSCTESCSSISTAVSCSVDREAVSLKPSEVKLSLYSYEVSRIGFRDIICAFLEEMATIVSFTDLARLTFATLSLYWYSSSVIDSGRWQVQLCRSFTFSSCDKSISLLETKKPLLSELSTIVVKLSISSLSCKVLAMQAGLS